MRRTLFLGVLASVLALSSPLKADWEVRRRGNEDLIEQAARALATRPTDRSLATRLVHLAGKPRLARLLEEFKLRAEERPPGYAPIMAYAELLTAAGLSKDAQASFERAATLRPEAIDPILGLARSLKTSGDRAGAIAAYQRALAFEKRPAERRRLLEALVALAADPAQVEHELAARRELARLDPRDDRAALALAELLERTGHVEEAARTLDGRLASGESSGERARPWKIDLALRAATLHEEAGDSDRANQILIHLLDTLPASAADRRRAAWTQAIRIARNRGGLPELARTLEGLEPRELAHDHGAHRPGRVEWEMLAQVRDELGDLDGALVAARHAAALDPRDVDLGRRLVALLDRLGRDDEATAALTTLVEHAPTAPNVAIELLERVFGHGQKERARALFDRTLTRFAANRAALSQLAELATRWSEEGRSVEAWTRLRRLAPHDEVAILGLGEQLFQRKKKDQAIRTWQALREGRSPAAEGHGRLAEVLMEHDLLVEATAEVQKAQALAPAEPLYHRVLAQILERQRRPDAAGAEWEKVLQMNRGPARSAERHEARSRLLGLAGRDGRPRLNERIRELQAQVKRDPQDREAALFLAEAEARNGNIGGAISTLRATIEQDQGHPAAATEVGEDVQGDAVLALVRLLRQTRQLDEAVRRLEELSTRNPARAREAQIQIADIELERYDDARALEHAERASGMSADNAQALVRVAELQERAGELERALQSYRAAFARDANPVAAFALSRLLIRGGSPREASEVLRAVLRGAGDEETITEAGRRAIDLEEYQGTLGELEGVVAGLVFSSQNGSAYRRVLLDLYVRLLPSVYRAPEGGPPASTNERGRMAQHGLRPLLELLTASAGEPDRALVELLGMLGNRDAAPALARLAQGPVGPASDSLLRLTPAPSSEVQLAAVIALGRLGDARGRAILRGLLSSPDGSLRAAAVWAYGRVAGSEAGDLLAGANDPRTDIAALSLLGLGRAREPRWGSVLATAAADLTVPIRVRRAAVIGLGLSGDRAGLPVLIDLLDSGDAELSSAAAAALGLMRDPSALPPLLERGLLEAAPRAAGEGPALAALDRFGAGRPLDDEGKAIEGNRLDVDALLNLLCAPPPASDRAPLWIERAAKIGEVLTRALAGSREGKLRALAALDSRDDGLALGRLTPGEAPLSAASSLALGRIAAGLRDRLLELLDEPLPEIQAGALRVLAKMDEQRLTPARIGALLARAPELVEAASFAAARQIARHPDRGRDFAAVAAPLLNDAGSLERRLAAVALLRAAGLAGRPRLETALRDPSPFVRAGAVEALAPDPAAIRALADLTTDPASAVRAAVARVLGPRKEPAARAALARLAQDSSPVVRAAALYIEP